MNRNIIYICLITFVLNIGIFVTFKRANADIAREMYQLMEKVQAGIIMEERVRQELIELKNSFMNAFDVLASTPVEIIKQIEIFNKLNTFIDTQVIPTAKEIQEKVADLDKIAERAGMSFKSLRENRDALLEEAKAFSEQLGKLRKDALLFSIANEDEYKQNYKAIIDHINGLQKSCVEDERGRNCLQQISAKLKEETIKSSNKFLASMSHRHAMTSTYLAERNRQMMERTYLTQSATDPAYNEALEELKKQKPLELNPVLE